eukprot:3764336-Prymnesium_polylepis.1
MSRVIICDYGFLENMRKKRSRPFILTYTQHMHSTRQSTDVAWSSTTANLTPRRCASCAKRVPRPSGALAIAR